MKSASVKLHIYLLITFLFSSFISGYTFANTKGTNSQLIASGVNTQDSLALVALYNTTDGANWTFNANWLTGPVAKWHGITVEENRVTEIKLFSNNLNGNIPPEISQLTNLTNLYLYSNTLKGNIPPEIGQLTELVDLYLYSNQLSGPIPPEIGQLSNLQKLYLYANQLSDSIPPEIGQLDNLEYLYLYSNRLSGIIPTEIGNLVNLKYLYLQNNQLRGNIPPEIGQLTNLVTLNLSNNKLSGIIPPEIGQLTKLYYLYLQYNKFSGALPPELGLLTSSYRIYLNNNNLSGNIPTEMGQLSRLQYLYLYNNQLSGSLPSELGQLSNLLYLDLTTNNLTDTIPSQLGQLNKLVELKMSTNQLSGTIPTTFGQLTNLKLLELDRNELTGDIPKELNHLENLETLSLTSNQLDGFLSDSLSDLPNLSSVFIFYNNLTFEDLENKMQLADKYFYYSPQDKIGQNLIVQLDTGMNYTLNVDCGGINNSYQWYFKGNPIGLKSDKPDYKITDIGFDDMGAYFCVITNSLVPNLSIKSEPTTLEFQPEGELAPTDIYLSNKDINENLPVGSEVGALTSEDEDLFDSHIYNLVSGEGDDNNASFFISGDHLYSFEIFDFETKNTYFVRIQTTDKQGFTFSKSFIITINNIEEKAPTDVTLSNNTIDENLDIGSLIGTFSTESENLSGSFKYSFVSGEGDENNASFFISDDQLYSKKVFNFEEKNAFNIRIQTLDKDGLSFSKSFTILINDIAEQAPSDISLSNNTIDENLNIGSWVGTFSTESLNLSSTFAYSFVSGDGDEDNQSFFISNDQLYSKKVFNFEEKSTYNIRVQTIDIDGLSFSKSFTILINDIEESAPTNIFLSNSSIDENLDIGTIIGTLNTESNNSSNTFTYTLVAGEGDEDNSSFLIVGNQLISRKVFNYEIKSSYTIRIQTEDNQGGQFSTSFIISINDIEEDNSLLVPDAFSPNGDGKNDEYRIKGIERYPNASIEVYNRYGNLVFHQENYGSATENSENPWWDGYQQVNGQRSSKRLPQGTYYMILILDNSTIYKKSIFLKD